MCEWVTLHSCAHGPPAYRWCMRLWFSPPEHALGPHTSVWSTRLVLPAESAASPAHWSVRRSVLSSAGEKSVLLRREVRSAAEDMLAISHCGVTFHSSPRPARPRAILKCTSVYRSSRRVEQAFEHPRSARRDDESICRALKCVQMFCRLL